MMKKIYAIALTALLVASCNPEKGSVMVDENTILLDDNKTTVSWLKDNEGQKLMPRGLFAAASDSLVEALGLQEGVPSSISTFLMHTDEGWSLFDAGLGTEHGGHLLEQLQARGLTPDSIKYIYLTHFHGDHIGGLLKEGMPLFHNAKLFANHVEYMYWNFEQPIEKAQQQHDAMEAYRNQVQLFAWGDTLPNGVIAIDAQGHTPGHTAFQKGNLLIIGDLMHGAALQLSHPEVCANFDMDQEKAIESRIRIMEMAQANNLHVAGMHLPDPAFIKAK